MTAAKRPPRRPHVMQEGAKPAETERTESEIDFDDGLNEECFDPRRQRLKETSAAMSSERENQDRVYREVLKHARGLENLLCLSPQLTLKTLEKTVVAQRENLRSGAALVQQLAADGFIDKDLVALLLALRADMVATHHLTSAADYLLVDNALLCHAHIVRLQKMLGNTALLTESELFGQEGLLRRFRDKYGANNQRIDGLLVTEHIDRMRQIVMVLIGKLQQSLHTYLRALAQKQEHPAVELEQVEPYRIALRVRKDRSNTSMLPGAVAQNSKIARGRGSKSDSPRPSPLLNQPSTSKPLEIRSQPRRAANLTNSEEAISIFPPRE